MVEQLATDPGAWSIIGWMLMLLVCGGAVLWVVSTLLLRGGRGQGSGATTDERRT